MTIENKRRRYDEAFKREAVRMLLESGKPAMTVARSIGIDRSNLQKWKTKFCRECAPGPVGQSCAPVGIDEFLSLKKDFDSVKETVEHLRMIVRKYLENRYVREG